MDNKKGYELLDIFKFIFCIMIIVIHTHLLDADVPVGISWYITHLLLRLAVPFFFIVSGFLYGKKILSKDANIGLITKKYIIRLLIPCIFWLIIGFIPELIKRDWNFLLTIKELYKNILFYPYGALWYVYALIVAVPILSLFYRKGKYILPIIIGFILYGFALLGNSYYFVACKIPILKEIVDGYIDFFLCTRNGIFVGILFVSLGVYIAKVIKTKNINMRFVIISFIIFYLMLVFEVYFIRYRIYTDDHSLFFSLPFLVSLLVIILVKLSRDRQRKMLRNMSTGMYFMHRVVLEFLLIYTSLKNNFLIFIIVLSICMIGTYLLLKLNNKYINKIIT